MAVVLRFTNQQTDATALPGAGGFSRCGRVHQVPAACVVMPAFAGLEIVGLASVSC
jgi:L-asparagine transporter-like permease